MKNLILNLVSDLVANFMYYDRKEDEDMPYGEIEKAIKDGVVTVDEICNDFRKHLEEAIDART